MGYNYNYNLFDDLKHLSVTNKKKRKKSRRGQIFFAALYATENKEE